MPSPLETQCQQLRTQIARSRRRLDRHARELVSSTTRLVSVERIASRGTGRWWLIALAASVALSRWGFGAESITRWRQQLLGQTVSRWLDRFVRRARVAAWQFRRSQSRQSTSSDAAEVTDE